jgi:hypothetical protein
MKNDDKDNGADIIDLAAIRCLMDSAKRVNEKSNPSFHQQTKEEAQIEYMEYVIMEIGDNLLKLQSHLLSKDIMSIDELHRLQPLKKEYLLLNIIKWQNAEIENVESYSDDLQKDIEQLQKDVNIDAAWNKVFTEN